MPINVSSYALCVSEHNNSRTAERNSINFERPAGKIFGSRGSENNLLNLLSSNAVKMQILCFSETLLFTYSSIRPYYSKRPTSTLDTGEFYENLHRQGNWHRPKDLLASSALWLGDDVIIDYSPAIHKNVISWFYIVNNDWDRTRDLLDTRLGH